MRNGAVTDGEHAHQALAVVNLVDDSVATDSKRSQSAKLSPEQATGPGITLEKSERLDPGVGDRPVELNDLLASAPGELDPTHLLRRDCSSRRRSSSVTVSSRST